MKEPFSLGDLIHPFSLQGHDGSTFEPGDVVGKPLVLCFYLRDGEPRCVAELVGFRDLYPEFEKLGASVVAVGVEGRESHAAFAAEHRLPFPLLTDADAKVALAHGAARVERVAAGAADAEPGRLNVTLGRRTVRFGPDFRAVKVYDRPEPATHAAEVLEDLKRLVLREEPRRIVQHAPVLLVPNVLPPEVCRRLIEVWETEGNEDSGFMRQVEGKTVGMLDYGHKIRRDHFVKRGSEVDALLKRYVGGRLIPEIQRSFNYEVTRYEDFRVACYDAARGGYFRPHRDNTTDGTAHRRFALSLLLSDEYEGGYLRFPEFGPHLYRPDAGGAVVFSCSLLHEATDVTAGRRFVLLSFLYGDREAKLREAYNQRVGGNYRA